MNRLRELRARTLEFEAQSERALAAKQTDPALAKMILNSAVGKAEKAIELRTGQPVAESRYEQAVSHYQQSARLTVKR